MIRALPISLTTRFAKMVHNGECVQLRRTGDVIATVVRGDKLWLREPWHTGAHWDGHRPTLLADMHSPPIISFAADLGDADPKAIGLGRRRFARELPKAFHRAHLIVVEVRHQRLHDATDNDSLREAMVCRADYPAFWDAECSPSARNITGTPTRWADNPRVTVLAFTLVREPLS
jgi:hypothetical protein